MIERISVMVWTPTGQTEWISKIEGKNIVAGDTLEIYVPSVLMDSWMVYPGTFRVDNLKNKGSMTAYVDGKPMRIAPYSEAWGSLNEIGGYLSITNNFTANQIIDITLHASQIKSTGGNIPKQTGGRYPG